MEQVCYHKEAFALGMFAMVIIYFCIEVIWGIFRGDKDKR
jgi:hypothetical protein